jgi:hypothetical protein
LPAFVNTQSKKSIVIEYIIDYAERKYNCLVTRVYPKVSGPATRCHYISILWVSLVSIAVITLYVASQRVFIVVSVYCYWLSPETFGYAIVFTKFSQLDLGVTFTNLDIGYQSLCKAALIWDFALSRHAVGQLNNRFYKVEWVAEACLVAHYLHRKTSSETLLCYQ